jgi:hypothetical protein
MVLPESFMQPKYPISILRRGSSTRKNRQHVHFPKHLRKYWHSKNELNRSYILRICPSRRKTRRISRKM